MNEPFSERLLAWFDLHGRKQLPWQLNATPYRVWVSEIMLQQTQVTTVIPYFERFLERFPTIDVLGHSSEDEVLQLWSGLGYYARARNLRKAAEVICQQYQGDFPTRIDQVVALPGIGRSTAGAVLSLSLGQRHAILDGNVKRVLSRHLAEQGVIESAVTLRRLWEVAETLTPQKRVRDYNQAMMDLGAMVCRRSQPDCAGCPVRQDCRALAEGCPTDYPKRKQKKAKPSRSCAMLFLLDGTNRVMLERQPVNGIWGGLWCPLQFPDTTAATEWLASRLRLDEPAVRALGWRRHTFSHYHLDYQPLVLEVEKDVYSVGDAVDQAWFFLEEGCQGGVPAPVQLLLKELMENRL